MRRLVLLLPLLLGCDPLSDRAHAETRDVRRICRAIHRAFESQEMRGEGSFSESPLYDITPETSWGRSMISSLTAEDPVPPSAVNTFVRRIVETRAHEFWDDCAVVIAAAAYTGDPDALAAAPRSTSRRKRMYATADSIGAGFGK